VRFDWSLGRGLAVIAGFSCEKAGRLKSSKARVIADGSEKNKKLILLILLTLHRLITVN
jgi:hypothetical protein